MDAVEPVAPIAGHQPEFPVDKQKGNRADEDPVNAPGEVSSDHVDDSRPKPKQVERKREPFEPAAMGTAGYLHNIFVG
jgi:hypothetical protein